MAFSSSVPAIPICDSNGLPLFNLLATSVCTTITPAGEQWMFGIANPNINQTFRYNRAMRNAAWQDYNNANQSVQNPSSMSGFSYDLGYLIASQNSGTDFTLFPAGTNGAPTPLITNSGLPGLRLAQMDTEYIAFADYQQGGTAPAANLGVPWGDQVHVSYKDPAVVFLRAHLKTGVAVWAKEAYS